MKRILSCLLLLMMAFCLPLSAQEKAAKTMLEGFSPQKANTFQKNYTHKKGNGPLKIMSKEDEEITLYGVNRANYEYCLGSFPVKESTTFTELLNDERLEGTGGAVYMNGKYYVHKLISSWDGNSGVEYIFDTKTWQFLEQRDISVTACATAMAYDPVSGKIYGQFYSEDLQDFYWGTYNPQMGTSNHLAKMDEHIYALAAAKDGTLYAINETGLLETLDKTNGQPINKIGNTGYTPNYIQSMIFDLKTGRLFWVPMNQYYETGLFEVNTADGKTTKISSLDDQITGLFTLTPEAEDGAPAIIDTLTKDFGQGLLTGKLMFIAPDKTFSNQPLSGELTCTVEVDGVAYTTKANAGSQVSTEVTVDGTGYHEISVFTENSVGRSPRYTVNWWIGKDTPNPATSVLLEKVDETTARLSWHKPTIGQHGGYINPDEVTYKIYRYPDNATVSESYADTTLTETVSAEKIQNLYYMVQSLYDGKMGQGVYSNRVVFGSAYEIPASLNFGDASQFQLCLVSDVNGDGSTWEWFYGGSARYTGNDNNSADDWIITPPFHLKNDRIYELTYQVAARNGLIYPERYEVKAGKDMSIEAMNFEVTPETELKSIANETGVETIKKNLRMAEDDNYNFGFHILSDAGWHQMDLYYMSIKEGPMFTAPDSVTNFKLTGGANGAYEATINFNAPLKDLNGKALDALTKIEISRNDTLIHTIESASPGQAISYTDQEAKQGINTYSAKAYNEEGGAGMNRSDTVFVGVDVPSEPEEVYLEADKDTLYLSWEAPTKGKNGRYINPDKLTYTVVDPSAGDIILSGITKTDTKILATVTEGEQDIAKLAVAAQNVAGTSAATVSNAIIVGDPYTLPFLDEFTGGGTHYQMWIQQDANGDGTWDMSTTEGYPKADGCLLFYGYSGGSQILSTGLVDISKANNAILSFYAKGNDGQVEVSYTTDMNSDYTPLKTINMSSDWQLVKVDLNNYKHVGPILIGFKGIAGSGNTELYVDRVNVRDVHEMDLEATEMMFNHDTVHVGKTSSKLSCKVTNVGIEDISSSEYSVEVSKDGNIVATLEGKDVKQDSTAVLEYEYIPVYTDEDTTHFSAKIIFDEDNDPLNNYFNNLDILVEVPTMPAPSNLTSEVDGNGVTLNWTAPDLSGIPAMTITDDFENYSPFSLEFLPWTTLDGDNEYNVNISGHYFPNNYAKAAFITFNPDKVEPAVSWKAHSGSQYLASFASMSYLNDDWLFTPELSGNAQTVSFFARSANNDYGLERFEVLYSNESTDTTTFTKIAEVEETPVEWTEYSYEIPEGAKFVAVRCTSPYIFAFLLDDFTYERAPQPLEVTFEGYNVYRDGTLLTSVPITSTTYSTEGSGFYEVTAVYDLGESLRISVNVATGIAVVQENAQNNDRTYDLSGRRIKTPSHNQIIISKGKKRIAK
ncbi:MAG: choice-of-anchor J domain-containing protein [Prevotella sp.]|jgi:hypothetical protein